MTAATVGRVGPAERHGSADLLFVGAGASTAYTLSGLFEERAGPPPERPLEIVVVDRTTDAFTGLPYGDRAARTCLLITSLREFLPEAERARFSAWLSRHKDVAFEPFLAASGTTGRKWWERHRPAIERDDFDDLFLPRYLFGHYLRARTWAAIADAEAAGTAHTRVLQGEVEAVRPVDGGWTVTTDSAELTSRRVVLAIGSPPALPRLADDGVPSSALLVDDPFADLPAALSRIAAALDRPADRRRHVVVLGGNASAMDVLYQVSNLPAAGAREAAVTVLTPRGELPSRIAPAPPGDVVATTDLDALHAVPDVSAEAIYRAALTDLERGRDRGLSAAQMLQPVASAAIALLPRLSTTEAAEFAGRWGVELGRHQRRAGREYWEVVDRAAEEGRFALVAGSFRGLVVDPDETTWVEYGTPDGLVTLGSPVDVVVNCAGPGGDLSRHATPLLAQLVDEGVCRLSSHGAGVAVGDDLAAAPGLHVMGPLLAGNVLDTGPLWHMEHCGRISAQGAALGRRLAAATLTR